MRKNWVKLASVLLVLCVSVLMFTACEQKGGDSGDKETTTTTKSATQPKQTETTTQEEEIVYVEWWRNLQEGINWKKDGPVSQFFVERVGVGMYMPLVIWEGGEGYFQKLQTRIATGDLPDIFIPMKGVETSLIRAELLWDLTDYLPKYAPNILEQINLIDPGIWDIIKAQDPTGKGGIYYLPELSIPNSYCTLIRQDWLDELGLAMPTNQAEYVNVLRKFKEMGPDIIPTIGREYGRWMDHLFFMYDVAMFEGYPCFDLYDGELTYSAVTPNMKEALAFIRSLYAEGLLDNEVFLNKAANLWEKVRGNRVGSWYHLAHGIDEFGLIDIKKIKPDVKIVVMPKIAAPGYEGYVRTQPFWGPYYAFSKDGEDSEKTLIAGLKLLDWLAADENYEEAFYGVEGIHHKVVDGKRVLITDVDTNVNEHKIGPIYNIDLELAEQLSLEAAGNDEQQKDTVRQLFKARRDAMDPDLTKRMASDGMPKTIYDGFSDIGAHSLYQQYMTQIIIGELPLEAFDEFVEKWYATGGEEVTRRAREWYAKIQAVQK